MHFFNPFKLALAILSTVTVARNIQTSAFSPQQMYAKTKVTESSRHRIVLFASPSQQKKCTEFDVNKLSQLDNCKSGTAARTLLKETLRGEGLSPLYGSISIPPGASEKGVSDGDLAIQTKIRNKKYGVMELIELNGDSDADRASLAVLSLFVASSLSAIVANQNLPGPEIFRFVVVWIFSFAPLAFVGYGIATPEKLQTLLVSLQQNIFPTYRKRMIHHEAGHFLMGHLLGVPVKGYATNAVKNAVEFYPLNDPDVGITRVRQLGFERSGKVRDDYAPSPINDTPFFSQDGRGSNDMNSLSVFRNTKNYTSNPFLKLPSLNDPSKSWPFRGFDDTTIDELTVISVAGVSAELLGWGNAEGGLADFSQLRQLFNSAQSEMDERSMNNRIRFSLGYTMSQLRLHLGVLDALAEVMARDGTVAECILAIETCSNVSGNDGISTDFEVRRREKLRSEGVNPLEKILLGGKNADTTEDRVIEGVGGGNRRKSFTFSGDDPFYAAIASALLFFLWATAGGLTLH